MKTLMCFASQFCYLASVLASTCQSPIALPVTNVLLSNQQSTRGIFATVGNPPQNISFMPDTYLNDTWIFNSTAPFCLDGTTSSQCFSQRGGLYNPAASNVSSTHLDVLEAGADPSDIARALDTHIWFNSWATDDFTLGNTTLHSYPIGMPGFDYYQQYDTQAHIGFGQNSSLLNILKASGLIHSRTYSFWYGIDSATPSASLDGQVVLGGYDAAKVIGSGITQPLLPPSANCPSGMAINIDQLTLNFPNASSAGIIGSNSIAACVRLNWPTILTMPYSPFYENFMSLTQTSPWDNSYGIYFYTYTYPSNDVYNGDLTISLQDGLSMQIPNDAIVVPDQMVGSSGAIVYNTSSSAVLIGSLQNVNANDEPLLGRVFFSSAYLMVDLDAMTYTMWPVNVTSESRLVASGSNCSSPSSQFSTPAPSTSSTNFTSRDSHESRGLNAGTIAGAVVGSVAGASLILVAVGFLVRNRRTGPRKPSEHAAPVVPAVMQQSHCDEPHQDQPMVFEMPEDDQKPQELDVVRSAQELEGSFQE